MDAPARPADPITLPARTDAPGPEEIARRADNSILTAVLAAARTHGQSHIAVEDGDKRTLSYRDLIRATAALSRVIRREVDSDVVGVMLPSSVGAAVTFLAVLAAGKTPAMLNFTAGRGTLLAACRLAKVGGILTAERFLREANLEPLGEALTEACPVIHLEAMRTRVRATDKAFAAAAAPLRLFPKAAADDPAAIVFTSGAEGDPKGVVLTHRNLLANTEQILAHVPLERVKILFNPLPVFHSFGIGPGLVLPLVTGRKVVFHPSPLRAKEVTSRVAETGAEVLFATDTFLRQYLRVADPASLSNLQFAVCGAERVRAETRDAAHSRFGFKVLEGYGVTETSPVLAVNHPDDVREGSVGQMLPGIEARLDAVEGMVEGRKLLVRGPNVMRGYLQEDGTIIPPSDGWHDTGDVVHIADDGHIAIRGRLKRFAKIGGEMTSLVIVEQVAGTVWPDALHAATALPGRKGEQIVLLTEEARPDADLFHRRLKESGLPERYLPARIIPVEAIPLLGTGKTDNPAVTRLAHQWISQQAA